MREVDSHWGCGECAAGTFSATGGNSGEGCLPCTSGTFSNKGASKCESCTPGDYMQEIDSYKSCTQCEGGKYSETDALSIDECVKCPLGFESSAGEFERETRIFRHFSYHPHFARRVGLLHPVHLGHTVVGRQHRVRGLSGRLHERHCRPRVRPL